MRFRGLNGGESHTRRHRDGAGLRAADEAVRYVGQLKKDARFPLDVY